MMSLRILLVALYGATFCQESVGFTGEFANEYLRVFPDAYVTIDAHAQDGALINSFFFFSI